jgi:hypothetical protein
VAQFSITAEKAYFMGVRKISKFSKTLPNFPHGTILDNCGKRIPHGREENLTILKKFGEFSYLLYFF